MYNLIVTGILFLTLSDPLLASDCFLSDNLECSCTGVSLRCWGVQKETTEVQELLTNVTAISSTVDFLYLDWNIKNLTFESNFTFEGLKLQNVTLGSDLTSLPDDLFLGLGSTLISLNLQNNNIELLSNQTFPSLFNLKELFLDFNSFNKIDADMLFNLSELELLSLSGNNLNRLESDFLVNLPMIHTLILNSNNFSSISDIKIKSVNLKELFARNCSINGSLIKDSLKDIPNLEHIDFSSNQLEEVDSYTFSDLHNLKVLNLSYNMLNSLKDNALSALKNLEILDLSNNKLLQIAMTSFRNLSSLKHLDLSANRLEAFSKDYTVDLFALESINLENNNIKLITTGTFSTSIRLQEMLLKGNIFDCTCDLSYFASYLLNNSHIKIGESSAATCNSPPLMKDTELIKIDIVKMNCTEEPDIKEDYYDDYDDITETSENVSQSDVPGIERTSIDNFNGTSEIELTTLQSTESITTEKINISNHNITSDSFDDSSDSTNITSSTNDTSTPEINTETSSFLSSTIKEEIAVTSQALENSTLPYNESTTLSNADFSSTSDLVTVVSTESVLSVTESEASKSIIDILENFKLGKDICIKWKVSDTITNVKNCIISTEASDGRKSKMVSCPKSSRAKQSCTPEKTYKFCINVALDDGSNKMYCPIAPASTTMTGNLKVTSTLSTVTSKSLPVTTVVDSSSESVEVTSTVKSTSSPLLIPYTSPTSVIPSTLETTKEPDTLSTTKEPGNLSTITELDTLPTTKEPDNLPSTKEPGTLSTLMQPDSSTDTPKVIIEEMMPHSVINFKVFSFDVKFIKSNSAAIAKWTVNKFEPISICRLKLSLLTSNFNDTIGEFLCTNSSRTIENIQHIDYNVCLMSYHSHSETQVLCKSSHQYSYVAETSKYKDSGYVNSALITVICLLIVVLIIIIIIAMKKMMKKRSECDRYNVSAEEQKVQRRFSQKRPESCVRYSYTTKEQAELIL